MKQRKIKEEKNEFYEKCSFCGLEISGTTESQVEYNLRTHIEAKHKENSK